MELWIRNQNRTLLTTVDRIHIYQATSNEYDIIGTYCTLGTYKTKKRALEVLDEIQKILEPKFLFQAHGIDDYKSELEKYLNLEGREYITSSEGIIKNINETYVYEMPKE